MAKAPLCIAAAALLVGTAPGCAPAPRTRVSFAEAGLEPAQAPRGRGAAPRLEAATEELLGAIERGTGERPALDPVESPPPATGKVRRRAKGWSAERSALAMELMRAIDTREGHVASVRHARAALRWDLALGARWSDVDRRLVVQALGRADAALAPLEPAPVEPEPLLDWPVDPVHVTSRYGVRTDPLGDGERRHVGVDFAATIGQRVFAAAAGTVTFAGERGGYGLHVEIRHAPGLVTRYAHLSHLGTSTGAAVEKGDLVGRAGRTGRSTGPHLHFELWLDGVPVDPLERLDGPAMLQTPRVSR